MKFTVLGIDPSTVQDLVLGTFFLCCRIALHVETRGRYRPRSTLS